jgi:acyl transferase domain-containing protein
MFSGQGAQYVNMGRELYESEPAFRERISHCAELLKPRLGLDLRDVLYPEKSRLETAAQLLDQTHITQPAVFVIEYALAGLWMDRGVRAQAMIGHSIGEYVAACLAGVFTLEDALMLVAARGRLMGDLPAGAMLAVSLSASKVRAMLGETVSLAAINSPSLSIISGPVQAVAELEQRFIAEDVRCRRLRASHAFHSPMMEPIVLPFKEELRRVKLSPPEVPYLSSLTGDWITPAQATDPIYWTNHLRLTVQFSDALQSLLKRFEGTLLEVGPGETLAALAREHLSQEDALPVLASLRHPQAKHSDVAFLLSTAGHLWLAGASLNWRAFHAGQQRRRVPLPTYPFERQRYWIEAQHEMPDADYLDQSEIESLSIQSLPRPQLRNVYVAPTNEVEHALAEIWEGLLGMDQVGIHDDFFSLGGHSLLATQLVSGVRATFEVDLPLHKFFEAATIADLALVIEEMLVEKVQGLTDDEVQNLLS